MWPRTQIIRIAYVSIKFLIRGYGQRVGPGRYGRHLVQVSPCKYRLYEIAAFPKVIELRQQGVVMTIKIRVQALRN